MTHFAAASAAQVPKSETEWDLMDIFETPQIRPGSRQKDSGLSNDSEVNDDRIDDSAKEEDEDI